ncbi:hypothetical protein BDF20DRAFT_1000695 [Mycotypha africana]|uniref:uncharacterized protein n=1 Tax=Mycotypha africana TaxID=64632 RepID=UPI0023015B6D|nr:uncharacterized protein BDF20DRAFT_1000695 [Mycotypha africana]KAI8979367.1 hypothetical protein BDF20DRAFT_1000695 [Mycotypha africana]
MEVDICCNVVQCRRSLALEKQACVTSCSHIFCVQCSSAAFSKALLCPACHTSLSGTDDIILTDLNPTEEYKSSVLAGLKPEVILDITSRAIAFFDYQQSQEVLYQTLLQKNIQEKYIALKHKFNMHTRDSNQIVKAEKDKQTALMKDFESEKAKLKQVHFKLEEKSRQFQKLLAMYEKLKRKMTAMSTIQQQGQNGVTTIRASHAATSTPFLSHDSRRFRFQSPYSSAINNQQKQILRPNKDKTAQKINDTAAGRSGTEMGKSMTPVLTGEASKTALDSSTTANASIPSPTKIPSPIHPSHAAHARTYHGTTAAVTIPRDNITDAARKTANLGFCHRPTRPPSFQQPTLTHKPSRHSHYHPYPRRRSMSPRSTCRTTPLTN